MVVHVSTKADVFAVPVEYLVTSNCRFVAVVDSRRTLACARSTNITPYVGFVPENLATTANLLAYVFTPGTPKSREKSVLVPS